jgi:anti-sigma-K factor RskA
MKLAHPELRNRLAAEYVLGTMRGGARRRFKDYVERDPRLQSEVARWEAHLTPLAGLLPTKVPAIEPPARVWSRIEAQLNGFHSAAPAKAAAGLWKSLGFWRSLGLGAAALATVLLVAMVTVKPAEQEPMMMAVLAEDNNDARVYIEQPKSNLLMVKMVKPWKTRAGIAHELWVIPKEGTPRSLGVINSATDTTIDLAGVDAKLANGTLFAVSLEPPGGSPSGSPTGKVVCKGAIAWMPPSPDKPRTSI